MNKLAVAVTAAAVAALGACSTQHTTAHPAAASSHRAAAVADAQPLSEAQACAQFTAARNRLQANLTPAGLKQFNRVTEIQTSKSLHEAFAQFAGDLDVFVLATRNKPSQAQLAADADVIKQVCGS
jgi:hypothetical protein